MVTESSREEVRVVADLVDGAANTRAAALEQIYRHHGSALFNFVACCTGSAAVAEQVVEEVFVRLWCRPRSFHPGAGSLRSHLLKDGHRRCVGLAAIATGEPRYGAAHRLLEISQAADDLAPDGTVAPSRGAGALWEALSLHERVAIGLVHFGDMTSAQVAEFLGVDEDVVRSRVTDGLNRLAAATGS